MDARRSGEISNPRWDFVLQFLGNPQVSAVAKERFIDLAFVACRTVESMEESGSL